MAKTRADGGSKPRAFGFFFPSKAALASFLIVVALAGCFGPMKFARQYDDWANEMYAQSAWLGQIQIVLYPVLMIVAGWIDFIALNALNFWFQNRDYNGDGTPFNHKSVPNLKGKTPKP